MPTAIDTLRFAKRLQGAGMAAPQAEAFAEAFAEAAGEALATKADIERLELRMDVRIDRLQIRLMTMMGAGFVATIAILGALIQLAHR